MVVLMLLWPTNDILEVVFTIIFHQQIARDFPIFNSPCNTIKMFQAENTIMIINLIPL